MNDILKELEKDNLGKVEYDVSMDKHTTYRVGGVASAIFYPKNVDGLIRFIRKAKQNNIITNTASTLNFIFVFLSILYQFPSCYL